MYKIIIVWQIWPRDTCKEDNKNLIWLHIKVKMKQRRTVLMCQTGLGIQLSHMINKPSLSLIASFLGQTGLDWWSGLVNWTGGLTFLLLKITFELSNEICMALLQVQRSCILVFINPNTQFSLCRLEVNNCNATITVDRLDLALLGARVQYSVRQFQPHTHLTVF